MKTNQLKQSALMCAFGVAAILTGCAGVPSADVTGTATTAQVAQTAAVDIISSKASQ